MRRKYSALLWLVPEPSFLTKDSGFVDRLNQTNNSFQMKYKTRLDSGSGTFKTLTALWKIARKMIYSLENIDQTNFLTNEPQHFYYR